MRNYLRRGFVVYQALSTAATLSSCPNTEEQSLPPHLDVAVMNQYCRANTCPDTYTLTVDGTNRQSAEIGETRTVDAILQLPDETSIRYKIRIRGQDVEEILQQP